MCSGQTVTYSKIVQMADTHRTGNRFKLSDGLFRNRYTDNKKTVMGDFETCTDTQSRWNVSEMAASPWGAQWAIREVSFAVRHPTGLQIGIIIIPLQRGCGFFYYNYF